MDCSVWNFQVGDRVRLDYVGVNPEFRGKYATVTTIRDVYGELDIEMLNGIISEGIRFTKDSQYLLTAVETPAPIEESALDAVLDF